MTAYWLFQIRRSRILLNRHPTKGGHQCGPMLYRVDATGCYIWQGCYSSGRPVTKMRGKNHYVTRVLYAAAFGPFDEGLFVRHRCDNPPCIRLDHLELGTCQENHDDQVWRRRTLQGDRNPRARLTEAQVREIRAHPEVTTKEWAERLNCPYQTVYGARRGNSWKGLS